MTWLLTALGVDKALLGKLGDLFARQPWLIAVFALLAIVGWQHWTISDLKADLTKCVDTRAKEQKDWDDQRKAATAAAAKQATQNKEAAQAAQENYAQLEADNDGLRAYVAAHSVRPTSPVPDTPARQDGGASLPPEPAADAPVAVPESVLATCDADYVYARAAYDWAQDLIARGVAQ